jgi:hypothetical protein
MLPSRRWRGRLDSMRRAVLDVGAPIRKMIVSYRLRRVLFFAFWLLGVCAQVSTNSQTLSEHEYDALVTKAAANDARNFCDDALPGLQNTDQEYVDCYYAVVEQRGRYFRGELEGQNGPPPVSEVLESSVTPR